MKIHEDFNPEYFQNNLAIIFINEIAENVLSRPTIGLINLPTASDASVNLAGRIATISGYGATNDNCERGRKIFRVE